MSSKEQSNLSIFFTPVIDSHVLLFTRGSYSEAPLYHLKHELFARLGKTFIKLLPNNGSTSQDKTYWKDLHFSEGTSEIKKGQLLWNPRKVAYAAE